MLKLLIQQITRFLACRNASQPEQIRLNKNSNSPTTSPGRSNRFNGVHSRPQQNSNGRSPHSEPHSGYRHNAERLLRDGHLRIAVTGFNDTAFEVSVMRRHDSPQLASAVANLPCKVKMVADRNIADGLTAGIKMLDDRRPGRRGIVLITSGDAKSGQEQIQQLYATAVSRKIGIHVIWLGSKAEDPIGGPRINTKGALGYGNFQMVETQEQLLAAIREAFQGLTPAFGMHGTNKAAILIDCSETMVEAYGNSTRIDMVISSLGKLLEDPLIRDDNPASGTRTTSCSRPLQRRKPVSWQTHISLSATGENDWSPRST